MKIFGGLAVILIFYFLGSLMSGGNIYCDRILSSEEITSALCEVFRLKPSETLVMDSHKFYSIAASENEELSNWQALCLINKMSGDYFYDLDMMFSEKALIRANKGYFDREYVREFCRIIKCNGLTSDDDINPYTWVLATHDGKLLHVVLDVDRFDSDKEEANIDPSSFIWIGNFQIDKSLTNQEIATGLSHIFSMPIKQVSNFERGVINPESELCFSRDRVEDDSNYSHYFSVNRRGGFPWYPKSIANDQWIEKIISFCGIFSCGAKVSGVERIHNVSGGSPGESYYTLVNSIRELGRFHSTTHEKLPDKFQWTD